MANFTAKDVQALRKSTGAGMMDAKKALVDADGDTEAATQILREKGLAKSAGRSDRDNAEGLVALASSDSAVALVQLRSETDFSAKSDGFSSVVTKMAELVLAEGPDAISQMDAELEQLKLTTKENLQLGTVARYESTDANEIDSYLHAGGKVGVLIEGEGVPAEALHEIALHIAFAKPTYLTRDEVPAAEVEAERVALLEITKAEGKPEQAWEKIVDGRVGAWFGERVLMDQGVLGDNKDKVADKVGEGKIVRFELATIGD